MLPLKRVAPLLAIPPPAYISECQNNDHTSKQQHDTIQTLHVPSSFASHPITVPWIVKSEGKGGLTGISRSRDCRQNMRSNYITRIFRFA